MASELNALIRTIIGALVDDPTQIEINEVDGAQLRMIEVTVGKGDVGKVIGRQGKTADAIRTILYAVSGKEGKRTILQILDYKGDPK